MNKNKRLYRSQTDSKIAGVCGGIAEYFAVDPTFVRIVALVLIFAHGIGLVGYLIGWIAMPKRPIGATDETTADVRPQSSTAPRQFNMFIPGVILVILGLIFLLANVYWWFDFWDFFWPSFLIVVGLLLLFGRLFKRENPSTNTSSGIQEIK